MKETRTLAPIGMVVYKRRDHFERTLNSLRANELAAESELYIFSDAAAKPEDAEGVKEVREYIRTITGFKAVHIRERESNYSYNNIGEGVTEVLQTNDRVIVLEDDLEVSPYFLQFMNDTLELYKDDPRVVCVEPGNYFDREGDHDFYFLQKLSSNGWGTWRDAWQWYERDGKVLWDQLVKRDLMYYFDLDDNYTNSFQLSTYLEEKHKSWKIRFEASILLNNRLVIYSGKPLVFNFGNDGSGISGRTDQEYYDYSIYDKPVPVNYTVPKLSHIGRDRMKQFYKELFHSSKEHRVAMRAKAILAHEPGHLKSLMQLAWTCLKTHRVAYIQEFKSAVENLELPTQGLREVLEILNGNVPVFSESEVETYLHKISELPSDVAMDQLQSDINKFPASGALWNELAVRFWEDGNESKAIDLLEEYVASHFPDPRVLMSLFDMHRVSENELKGNRYLSLCLDIDPNFPSAILEMAGVKYDEGKFDDAAWYYHQLLEYDIVHAMANRRLMKLDQIEYTGEIKFNFYGDVEALEQKIEAMLHSSPNAAFHLQIKECDLESFMLVSDYKRQGYITSITWDENAKQQVPAVSIVMFSYDRLEYTQLTMERLKENTDYPFDFYIIDNHSTDGTVEWWQENRARFPFIKDIVFNAENEGLPKPTNEFWARVQTPYIGKIDNDTLVPECWLERLVQAHERCPEIGVVGGYHFRPEDFNEEDAANKLFLKNDIGVVQDTHIGGCCYLMKRSLYEKYGPMVFDPRLKTHGWTQYQNRLAHEGYIVGYLYPLIQLDYMDDPRSHFCLISSKYQAYTKKIWAERGVDFKSEDQLVAWLHQDAQRVTESQTDRTVVNKFQAGKQSAPPKKQMPEYRPPHIQRASQPSDQQTPPKATSALGALDHIMSKLHGSETPSVTNPPQQKQAKQEQPPVQKPKEEVKETQKYYGYARPEVQALVSHEAVNILDIGCSAGLLGAGIKDRQECNVVGIEYVPEVGAEAKKRLDEVYIGDATKIVERLKSAQFDAIIMADFLEHIATPEAMLTELKRLLSPNGQIVMSIPNVRHWSIVKDLLEGNWEYQDAGILDRTHLKFFTLRSLVGMLDRLGFKVDACSGTTLPNWDVPKGFAEALSTFGIHGETLEEEGRVYQYLLVCSVKEPVKQIENPSYQVQAKPETLPKRYVPDFSNDKRPLVSLIILAYNALKVTKECVESILNYTKYPYEIIFVDNASSDGSTEYLQEMVKQYTHFSLIVNKENRGFSGGNNQGVEAAKGKYIMLLNNDVVVSKGWLEGLVHLLEMDENIGAVGPLTNYISGRQTVAETSYKDTNEFLAFADTVRTKKAGDFTPRRRLAGFAILMEKELYERVDGLDETYGIGNFEDDDLSLKIRDEGLALMVNESVFIHHYGSQTFKENNISLTASLNENRKLFEKKWPKVNYNELIEIEKPLHLYEPEQVQSAYFLLDSGQTEDASYILLAMYELNPINPETLFGLGLYYRAIQEYENAEFFLDKMIKIDPKSSNAYNLKGLILVDKNALDVAEKYFAKAIESDGANVDAQLNYSELFFMKEDFETGVQVLKKILENHPDNLSALLRFYDLYLEIEKYEDANTIKNRILEIDPNFHFES